ncbi:MAG: hypothetical protein V4620_09480 [Bacteroidota bacterium]
MPLNTIPEQPLVESIQTLLDNVADIFTESLQQQQTLISNFLQLEDNRTIRVFVADSPGMGHQSNTVLIMSRLIQLGFNQNYDVVYAVGEADNLTADKLIKLIPGFVPNANGTPVNVALNASTTASMIPLPYFKAHAADYPLLNFGFTGGFDSNATNLANKPYPDDPNAKGVNVNLFLKLQPYQWAQENAIQQQDLPARENILNVAALGGLTYGRKRGYFINAPAAPTQASFVAPNQNKYTPYQKIIAACTSAENPINLLPVYGIGGSDVTGATNANPAVLSQNVLFDLITAVRYTQRFSTLANLQRGAIIVNIADIPAASYTALNTLLSGAAADLPNLNALVTQLPAIQGDIAANHVEVINYDNADLDAKIAALQGAGGANKILVIKMGGLPISAFDYMYACSSLPSLLEGKATANLVLNLNKPYLNLLKDAGIVYPTLPLNAPNGPTATRCNNAVLGFKDSTATINASLGDAFILNPPSAGLQATPIYTIASLTIDAYKAADAAGSLRPYFTDLYNFFQNQQQDKLFLGLLYFLSFVNNLDGQ